MSKYRGRSGFTVAHTTTQCGMCRCVCACTYKMRCGVHMATRLAQGIQRGMIYACMATGHKTRGDWRRIGSSPCPLCDCGHFSHKLCQRAVTSMGQISPKFADRLPLRGRCLLACIHRPKFRLHVAVNPNSHRCAAHMCMWAHAPA